MAWWIVRMLAWHETSFAVLRAALSAGMRTEIRIAMIPMTTSSSTSVNALRRRIGRTSLREDLLRRAAVAAAKHANLGGPRRVPLRDPGVGSARALDLQAGHADRRQLTCVRRR